MILKYIVPQEEQWRYDNNKIIYCKITQKKKLEGFKNTILYKVKMINYNNLSNIFLNKELKKINLLDLIKIKLIKRG